MKSILEYLYNKKGAIKNSNIKYYSDIKVGDMILLANSETYIICDTTSTRFIGYFFTDKSAFYIEIPKHGEINDPSAEWQEIVKIWRPQKALKTSNWKDLYYLMLDLIDKGKIPEIYRK